MPTDDRLRHEFPHRPGCVDHGLVRIIRGFVVDAVRDDIALCDGCRRMVVQLDPAPVVKRGPRRNCVPGGRDAN